MIILAKIKTRIRSVAVKSLEHPFFHFAKPFILFCLSFKWSIQTSRVCSVKHYVNMHYHADDRLIKIGNGEKRLIYAAPQYDQHEKQIKYVDADPIYIAVLNEVTVLAESNLIFTKSGWGLNDMIAYDTEHRLRLQGNKGFDCIVGEDVVYTFFYKKPPIHLKHGVMVSGNYSFNYYHLTFEILPKLINLDTFVPKDVPLLIDDAMLKYVQYRELLEMCNTSGRKTIVLPKDTKVNVETLYYPSIASHIVPNIKAGEIMRLTDAMFDSRSLEWLRTTLLPRKSDRFFGEKIFLYRNSNLRLFNQDEVFDKLQELGYIKIATDDLSIEDQISLFNNAKEIVSGSGAALTNTIYCSPGCKLLILTNGRYETITVFSSIAKFTGAQMRYVDAEMSIDWDNVEIIHNDFYINPQRVIDALNT